MSFQYSERHFSRLSVEKNNIFWKICQSLFLHVKTKREKRMKKKDMDRCVWNNFKRRFSYRRRMFYFYNIGPLEEKLHSLIYVLPLEIQLSRRGTDPISWYNPETLLCTCSKPGPGPPTSYIVGFFFLPLFSELMWEVIVRF